MSWWMWVLLVLVLILAYLAIVKPTKERYDLAKSRTARGHTLAEFIDGTDDVDAIVIIRYDFREDLKR